MKTKAKWIGFFWGILLIGSSPALAAKGLYLGAGVGGDYPDFTQGDKLTMATDKTGRSYIPLVQKQVQTDIGSQSVSADAAIDLGYGFTKNIYAGLYADISGGEMQYARRLGENPRWRLRADSFSYQFERIGILGKYSLGKSITFAPYLELGVDQLFFSANVDGTFTPKIGEMAGFGMDWFLGQRKRVVLSADLSYLHDTIEHKAFNKEEQIVLDGISLLFKIGYVWRPGT